MTAEVDLRVCVVIVTHNAGIELQQVVRRYLLAGARVLCVDNASEDDTVRRARNAGASVVCLSRNIGYGAAFNIALHQVAVPVVLCANQDVLPQSGTVSALSSAVREADGLVIASPRLVTGDGSLAETAHLLPRPARHLLELLCGAWCGRLRNAWPFYDPEWVSGALLAASRRTWLSLQGFDSAYFMYVEDVDLFMRLQRKGGSLVYLPDVDAVHLGGRRPLAAETYGQTLSNWIHFYRRHFGSHWAMLAVIAGVIGAFGRGVYHAVRAVRRPESRGYAIMFLGGVVRFLISAYSPDAK